MKVTWLGQAGLLFEFDSLRVMIDPYLSDSLGERDPAKQRRIPVDESFFQVKPDILIFTHAHADHYDPKTVERLIAPESEMTVLAPPPVWDQIRCMMGRANCVLFRPRTSWTQGGLRITAVRAEHSDPSPIGVVLEDGTRRWYVTGDTLYNEDIFQDLPRNIYGLFLPVNGAGNNMNMADAARFAARVGAERVVPLHFGLFDSVDPRNFSCKNRVILEIYRPVEL